MKIIWLKIGLTLSLLMLSAPLFAQTVVIPAATEKASFDETYQNARARNPAGLKFTIDLGGKTQFHRGEIISINLHFSSDGPIGFKLEPRNYDRVGRLNLTDFFITDRPQDAPDPLGAYFSTNLVGLGGLSAMPQVIGPKIQTISLTLNEYLRFDKPGHYRLYILSNRLFPAEKQFGPMFGGMLVASDVIGFDISEGEEWAQHRSREIEAILSAPADATLTPGTDNDDRRYAALARELRFLDTPLSRRLMIANYGNPQFKYNGEFHFGLIGTRYPDDAIAAVREHLQDPDGAVPTGLLQDLTTLLFSQSNVPPPPYPSKAAKDSVAVKQYYEIAKVREQKCSGIFRGLLDDLRRALPAKRGKARAITLTTLIENLDATQKLTFGANAVSDDPALQSLRRQLLASWNDLPRESQKTMLNDRWPLIRDPALLPLLVRANEASLSVNPNESDNYEEREWRSLLLVRINQLSPAVGRQYLLAEMKRPNPRVDSGILLDLPDLPLSPLETVWLRNLREHTGNYNDTVRVAQLVARYASPKIAVPLRTWFDKNPDLSVEARAALLAYFARVRPQEAAPMIEAEISAHKQPIFEAIGAFTMNANVEAVATKYLQNANLYLAADAARALSAYGSVKVEAALWARMEKWHAALQGKTLDNQQVEFETTLAQALTLMPSVQTKRANLDRLRALCWSSQARERLNEDYFPNNGYGVPEIHYHPTLFNHYPWSFGRNRKGYWSLEALTQKLRQFPRGTVFSFRVEGIETTLDVQSVAARLEAWLKPHGYTMKIVKER